ncbi:L-aspartate oxidase [uncultured delta proteobacterium]|uniref:L-aspartate oxidase n=1 Tax=uncultured delta proteobacterium TaxID=34034 RepID=A0A212KA77_9DELT|nr:L-aspartate oxidase [uncultured delta proteobacterium]
MPASAAVLPVRPDVLVVGGGLAGLMAALAARREGRSMAVLSLGPAGLSGNTLVAGGVISGASRAPGNTADLFFHDLIASGQGLADPELASRLAGDSSGMLECLESLGVPLRREGRGFRCVHPAGHSVPRTAFVDRPAAALTARGRAFLDPLLAALSSMDVPLLNGLRVTDLLRGGGRVAGVAAVDRKSGERLQVRAGAVVLATGGYGGLFRKTDNVSDSHGDGLVLALEAGCALRDMEMVQFYPNVMPAPFRLDIPNSLFRDGAVLRNRNGERFILRHNAAGELMTRDALARAIALEIRAGGGVDGCVYTDCRGVPENVLRDRHGLLCAALAKRGIDPRKDWLKGEPVAHYTMGGIRVDPDGRTGIPGLYAAGEICGGVHGANRLAGAALMEAAVFGRRAGMAAAREAGPLPAKTEPVAPSGKGTDRPAADRAAAMKRLREILWTHASILRDAAGLRAALDETHAMREEWGRGGGPADRAFGRTLRLAGAVTASALLREESRGAHCRTDYPGTSPDWAVSLAVTLQGGALSIFRDEPARPSAPFSGDAVF